MRVTDTNASTSAPGLRRRTGGKSAAKAESTGSRTVSDITVVMGIPAADLSTKVQEAITTLMAEVENLRSQIEKQKARIAYLEQLADEDSLLPITNRRAFVRELSRVMSYGQRYNTPSSIVFIDVNGLKSINDTHGHAAGDAALLAIGRALEQNVRESDLVSRLGGDEFGVLLANTDEAAGREKAAQLAEIVRRTPLEWQGATIPLLLAHGTYTIRGGEENASEALDAADRAMYANKGGEKIRAAS